MLRVIGAGLPRTGTHTLKVVLSRLLDGECYHMTTVFEHPEHVATWQAAADGEAPDWSAFMGGYVAAVDWPASAFWPELADAFPDALILLSTRTDGEAWWRSADATIMEGWRDIEGEPTAWQQMGVALWHRVLGPSWEDPASNVASYGRWVERVRAAAPSGRLLEWQATDGWAPLCAALGVEVPDEPFPVTNSSAEWEERRRQRADEEARGTVTG